jgi:excisionase family DNA binding protein
MTGQTMRAAAVQRKASRRAPRGSDVSPAQELNDFVDSLSGSVSARLAAKVAKSIRLPEKQLRVVFESAIPGVLQAEFESSLLAGGPEVRATRARLAHVLTSAELVAAVPAMHDVPRAGEADVGLTSGGAARLLHVSRSHVNALADSGALGEVMKTAGGHRRLSRAAVLAYKEQSKRQQAKGLAAMMAATEEAGLYDLKLESAPPRKRKSK